MWQATVYVTELRDWTKPIFRGEAQHEDPATLLPFLLEQACREPVLSRMRHLNLATDGLSVVLYLARADSRRNSSNALLCPGSPSLVTTSVDVPTPSCGVSSHKTPTETEQSEFSLP